jgi:hypothetical protein
MFGWSSLLRIVISLAMNLILSAWNVSNLTFFRANIFPVSTSRARKTLLYVPCPIYKNGNIKKEKSQIQSGLSDDQSGLSDDDGNMNEHMYKTLLANQASCGTDIDT